VKRLALTAVSILILVSACTSAAGTPNPSGMWQPAPGERWQYQLQHHRGAFPSTGGINVDICEVPASGGACVTPQVFDIDLYANLRTAELNTAAVEAIHAAGGHAICYVDAGSIETYRPDYQAFVDFDDACDGCLIGKPFSKIFSDENYANINNGQGQRDFMLQMNEARVTKCEEAGFDAVEFDVVAVWETSARRSGWHISAATQLIFNRALADIAHRHGMSVALKNDPAQIPDLEPSFDFAINEQCFQYHECSTLDSFVEAGKAVFSVEYRTPLDVFCPRATKRGFGSILKAPNYSLFDEPYTPCR
jgi:hypothetical protein